jgi:hypothetical protein
MALVRSYELPAIRPKVYIINLDEGEVLKISQDRVLSCDIDIIDKKLEFFLFTSFLYKVWTEGIHKELPGSNKDIFLDTESIAKSITINTDLDDLREKVINGIDNIIFLEVKAVSFLCKVKRILRQEVQSNSKHDSLEESGHESSCQWIYPVHIFV